MSELLIGLLPFLIGIGSLLLLASIGVVRERKHLANLERRSEQTRGFPLSDTETVPLPTPPTRAWLVDGSAVVSAHRGKQWLAQFRNVFGGEMKSISVTNTAARQEAQLRMIEQAIAGGAVAVVNLRINHAAVSSGRQLATEVLVVGTAVA